MDEPFGHVGIDLEVIAEECLILGRSTGCTSLLDQFHDTGEKRQGEGINLKRDLACAGDVVEVAGQSEPGDIGRATRASTECALGSGSVQSGHRFDRVLKLFFRGEVAFSGGRDDAGTEWLGEVDVHTWKGVGVGENVAGIDRSGHGKPKFWLRIFDTMATYDNGSRFDRFVIGSEQDIGPKLGRRSGWIETSDVHDGERCAPHRVDIAERIGGSDRAIGIGIVDDGSEEIHRLHEC